MEKKPRGLPSVKGLANIGALLGRGDLPQQPPREPKRERRTQEQIYERTMEKVSASLSSMPTMAATHVNLIQNYVRAAVREAYNLGHADALEQNGAVEALLEQQYQARTKLTMPAVVAAVMEQQGLSSMTLDLAHMATVFKRNEIKYTITDEDVIEYTMRPVGD
jgi:2-hydroxychromene-2-carboxylate isomerase